MLHALLIIFIVIIVKGRSGKKPVPTSRRRCGARAHVGGPSPPVLYPLPYTPCPIPPVLYPLSYTPCPVTPVPSPLHSSLSPPSSQTVASLLDLLEALHAVVATPEGCYHMAKQRTILASLTSIMRLCVDALVADKRRVRGGGGGRGAGRGSPETFAPANNGTME